MRIIQIIDDLENTITNECQNINDIEGYIENCLLVDVDSAAAHYGITTQQYFYCVNRAAMRL